MNQQERAIACAERHISGGSKDERQKYIDFAVIIYNDAVKEQRELDKQRIESVLVRQTMIDESRKNYLRNRLIEAL